MIEEVEELGPKLHAQVFSQSSIFDYGKISIIKTRTDNYITTEITKTRHRSEHGRIKPLVDAADCRDWTSDVWAECIRDAIHGAVAGNDVHRTAALDLNDRGQLPTFNKRIGAEWQVVYSVADKTLPCVKI